MYDRKTIFHHWQAGIDHGYIKVFKWDLVALVQVCHLAPEVVSCLKNPPLGAIELTPDD